MKCGYRLVKQGDRNRLQARERVLFVISDEKGKAF